MKVIKRVNVCPNTNSKILEYEDGSFEEYEEKEKDETIC